MSVAPPSSLDQPEARPPAWWRGLGLFVLVVAGASIAGGLVEWTARWVLPSVAATFLSRLAMIYPVLYWMPVILAETPSWSRRKRTRFAALAGIVLATMAMALGS